VEQVQEQFHNKPERMNLIHWSSLFEGNLASLFVLLKTAYVEYTFCLDDVQRLLQRKGGVDLYRQALFQNVINVQLLGTLTYYVTVVYCCCHNTGLSLGKQLQCIVGIVLLEGVFYTLVHKAFHDYKCLWFMHSFHHKFNHVILPSTANAVSIYEFVIAYMLPITVGTCIMGADRVSAVIAAGIIGMTSMLIHTPFQLSTRLPTFLVSTSDHFEHHRKYTTNYSAPLVHVERILTSMFSHRFLDVVFTVNRAKVNDGDER
jgi:sterol desaturase/sphingolipid hydroxylase (fatty acid hydroxylase superfamily)